MGGSAGKLLGGVSNVLAPIASLAGPILTATGVGAPIGAAVSGLGGVLSGVNNQNAQKKQQAAASGATQQQSSVGNAESNQYLKEQPGVLGALKTNAGFDPVTGKYNADYNPYAHAATSLAGALPGQAESIFSPGALTGGLEKFKEAGESQYDNGVDAVKHDLAGSGFAGSSAADSQIGSIRRQQAEGNAAHARDLSDQLQAERANYVANGTQQANNLTEEGARQGQANLGNLENVLTGGAATGANILQGANTQFQGQANTIAGGNAADAKAGAAAGYDPLGNIINLFKKKPAINGINGPVNLPGIPSTFGTAPNTASAPIPGVSSDNLLASLGYAI